MFGRLASVALTLLLSGALNTVAAQSFEGVLHQRMIDVDLEALADMGFEPSEEIFEVPMDRLLALRGELESVGAMSVSEGEMMVKGLKMRMDISDESGPGYAILDLGIGVTRFVRPGEGVYIEITPEDMEMAAGMASGFDAYESETEMMETGLTRTINGMRATAFDFASYDGTTRVWVSEDDDELTETFRGFADAFATLNMGEEPDPSMSAAAMGVPVLSQSLGYDSYSVEEILSVERRPLDDSVFEVPAGFERMSMQDIFGAFMGGEEEEGLSGLFGGGEMAPIWIEYEITGAVEASGHEDDVLICAETDDGFQARSIGDYVLGFEADGGREGTHDATISLDDDAGRFRGPGTITINILGQDAMGFPIYEVEFESSSMESRSGASVSVSGTMSCAAMG